MYLKSIEIHGFKSFANKIVLDFHNGITGIVGPNGSGKSNIADAVRWVLGEQSAKQLRGASMQDVIFAGTENRKPMSYASVAITLDNSDHQLAIDYDEVTIGRRVYRSGESEYLINGNVSRLKEVHELFYDTGIGKEGYSIIGQGQIDRILSGKPEERRELFDEAAGIVKFKRRKNTAQKKLDHERENLTRVNDILMELERQVGPLARQSEKARTYLKKKEELKAYDVNQFLLENEKVHVQQAEVEEKYANTDAELQAATAEYEQIKQEYDQLGEALTVLDEQIDQIRTELASSTENKQRLESQIELLKEQIHTAEMTGEHLGNRLEAIDRDHAEKQTAREGYQLQEQELKESLVALQQNALGADADYQKLQSEMLLCSQEIERAQADLIALLNEKAGVEAQKQKFATMQEQANIRKSQNTGKLLEWKTKEADYDDVVAAFEKEYRNVLARLEKLQNRIRELERKDLDWKQKIRENNKRREEADSRYHKQESRLDTLRNIAERYDGYGSAIRKVMEQKSHNKGILGVVSDLIQVEKKYETAIETALGGSIQNIVTVDEDTAKDMIRFLKENRFGRATFLPLTSITARNNPKNDAALKEPGVLGVASDLVKCDNRYREITAYLLGRILVVDHIDHAQAVARKFGFKLHIVTLEGEYLNPGGSMTGGAFKNTSNLLARNREIEELEKQLKATRQEMQEILSRRDDLSTAQALCQEELEELRGKLQEQLIIQNTASMNVETAKSQKHDRESAYDMLQFESSQIEKELEEIRENQAANAGQQEDLAARIASVEATGNAAAARMEELSARDQAAQEKVQGNQLQHAEINKTIEFVRENITRLEGELAKLDEEAAELRENAALAAQDIEKKQIDIQEIALTLENSGSYNEAKGQELTEALSRKDSLNRSYRGYFDRQEKVSEHKNALDKELYRLQSQRERLAETDESQINYMWQEYELTPHAAKRYRDEELGTLAELKRMTASIKDEIRKLGDVNVNAIEEYKEVNERYTFMKTQHDDLIIAEKTLMDIIRDLDNGMRRQFAEKFAEIQREFDRTFRELFGGGHGTLELVEGEDILECGIRIIAQPPGKKLQNMMQLSGGEKALSAIALLFAIQSLKPSPFCLLDEIEAALDDSNVGRYAGYLSKLTRDTQFIVITHRRGTMTAADRLYGITMQEKGISTLVSVNLIEEGLTD